MYRSDSTVFRGSFAQEGPALISVPIDYSENMKLSDRLGQVSVPI